MNFKAIFFGIGAGILGALAAGFFIGMSAGSTYGSSSMAIQRYMANNIELVYMINVTGGIACGLVVTLVAKRRLFQNLFVASTTLIILSVITNPALLENLMAGRFVDQIIEQALLPLFAGWVTPLFFAIFDRGQSEPQEELGVHDF